MPTANQFQGFTASVFPSQDAEIVIAKQAALSDHGREVRAAVNQLPSEVSRSLLGDYKEFTPQVIASAEAAIMTRELAIENAEKEVGLDVAWLQSAATRRMDEVGLSAGDDWNEPAM